MFFKGALLQDPHRILITQTETVQSARQIRFRSLDEITNLESTLTRYIQDAIRVEKAGLKVEFKKTAEFRIPDEFQQALDKDPALKLAFEALTPCRQRAYLMFFTAPKQVKTRQARVENHLLKILSGKGLND